MPPIQDKAWQVVVPVSIEFETAEDSIELAAVKGGQDRFQLGGPRFGYGLGPNLNRRILPEGITDRFGAGVLEPFHHRSSAGVIRRIRREGNHRAFAGVPGNLPELVGGQPIPGDKVHIQPRVPAQRAK